MNAVVNLLLLQNYHVIVVVEKESDTMNVTNQSRTRALYRGWATPNKKLDVSSLHVTVTVHSTNMPHSILEYVVDMVKPNTER